MVSPAATPSPSGSRARPFAFGHRGERVAGLRAAACRDVTAVLVADDDAVEVQLAVGPARHRNCRHGVDLGPGKDGVAGHAAQRRAREELEAHV